MIAKPGAVVTYAHPKNGHLHDKRLAFAHLTEGHAYTVARTIVGGWQSHYVLAEIPDVEFNTVLFEVSGAKPAEDGCCAACWCPIVDGGVLGIGSG